MLPKKPPRERAPGAGAPTKYVEIYDMTIGGSHEYFNVPRHRLDAVCSQVAKRLGRRYTVRLMPGGSVGVWRLK